MESEILHFSDLLNVRSGRESEPGLFTPSLESFSYLYLMTGILKIPEVGMWYWPYNKVGGTEGLTELQKMGRTGSSQGSHFYLLRTGLCPQVCLLVRDVGSGSISKAQP